MGSDNKTGKTQKAVIELLGMLIVETFQNKYEDIKNEVGLKELLKMVELYNKLSPVEPGHKKFWDMLTKIRQNALDEKKEISPPKTRRRTAPGKVKAA